MTAKINIEFSEEEKELFQNVDALLKNVQVIYKGKAERHIEILRGLINEVATNKAPQTMDEMENLKKFLKDTYNI